MTASEAANCEQTACQPEARRTPYECRVFESGFDRIVAETKRPGERGANAMARKGNQP